METEKNNQGQACVPQTNSENCMPQSVNNGLQKQAQQGQEKVDNVHNHSNPGKLAVKLSFAYTQGTDIHVAPGQEQHLPHEVWHVAQQMAGRVEPTTEVGGLPVNDNPALEHEADVMGAKADSL